MEDINFKMSPKDISCFFSCMTTISVTAIQNIGFCSFQSHCSCGIGPLAEGSISIQLVCGSFVHQLNGLSDFGMIDN